ncbi:hypothetical protein LG201_05810 [Methylobacillus gramineus]|uniref:hypothetical protein n=1 Tax=Methylobacillus gramineus TaxID=755169 RepID=UPI001CFFAC9C|nr:hypothetical protein [Methylobacillus gramineus]MCB5184714.1 hypothetical protein [Methylobacillus gramineus]
MSPLSAIVVIATFLPGCFLNRVDAQDVSGLVFSQAFLDCRATHFVNACLITLFACWALVLGITPAYAVSSISIEADKVELEAGNIRNLKAQFDLDGKVSLQGQVKARDDQQWTEASLGCTALMSPRRGHWRCQDGKLAAQNIQLPFSFELTQTRVENGERYSALLDIKQASFSDAAGLRAGEKLTASLGFDVVHKKQQWQWQAKLDWKNGELFWQPFYFPDAGHQLVANGSWDDGVLTVSQADLSLNKVGSAKLSGKWIHGQLDDVQLNADDLNIAALYPLLLQPMLENTALDKLELEGRASLKLTVAHGELRSFLLDLKDADVEDQNGRFTLYKINTRIPWSYDDPQVMQLAYESGHLLKIPLGQASIMADVDRYSVTTSQLYLPILDGALSLTDVSAARVGGSWHWHLRANLVPISMPELSHALGWPRMEGKVAAAIPMVTYSGGNLVADGDLLFQLFNGNISVSGLNMQTPLGLGPRLNAHVTMRQLDLGDITRTFSFGAIEGKLDGDVQNLELSNWQPVKFDASLRSSPGNYRKKISQRAVENITSLGGAGAAAAIQRSVLRFFSEFNYKQIGWKCQLRNDVCQMSGVEYTPQGYVIVKGSGIPAITVMGYNHNVGWSDLLARLKRVTEGNSKPVIK